MSTIEAHRIDERVEVRVRGECGHEWTTRTGKAGALYRGETEWSGLYQRKIRMACPECYAAMPKGERMKQRGANLTPVVVIKPDPNCSRCGKRRSIYNPGPWCFACDAEISQAAAARVKDPRDRILAYLEHGSRTIAWLALALGESEHDVRGYIFDLIGSGHVWRGDKVKDPDGRFLRLYGLSVRE